MILVNPGGLREWPVPERCLFTKVPVRTDLTCREGRIGLAGQVHSMRENFATV